MQAEIGKIYEGKVTGITKFGAFVELEDGVSGMVHISEVAPTFVNDIKDHLTMGQEVKVKVISIGEDGKIALSIKKAMPRPAGQSGQPRGDRGGFKPAPKSGNTGYAGRSAGAPQPDRGGYAPREFKPGPASFEDMLNKFKQSSDEKMGDIKRNMDGKRRGSRKR